MDITRKNFRTTIPLLKSLLPQAQYIAIDLEFTGLGNSRPSQLDTPSQRYNTFRSEAEEFPPLQFGLCLCIDGKVTCFNYHLFPRAVYYPMGRNYPLFDKVFQMQSSTVKFLQDNGFGFDHCFEMGCSWLVEGEEQKLRQIVETDIRRRRSGKILGSITEEETEAMEDYKTKIEKMLKQTENIAIVEMPEGGRAKGLAFSMIKRDMPLVVATTAYTQEGMRLRLEKVESSDKAREEYEKILQRDVDDIVVCETQFRYVVDAIRAAKKPLVLHNGLLDIVKMYGNFVGALPETFEQFKELVLNDFVHIWDTKRMLQIVGRADAEVRFLEGKGRSLEEICRDLEMVCKKRGKMVHTDNYIPTSKVTDHGLLSEAFVSTDGGYVIERYASREDRTRDKFGFGSYIGEYVGDTPVRTHEAGYDSLQTMRLFLLLEQFKPSCQDELFLGSCGGYKYVNLRQAEENVYFDLDAIVIQKGEEFLHTRHHKALAKLLEGSEFDCEGSELYSGGDRVFLSVLKRKEGKRGAGLDDLINKGKKLGLEVWRYEPSVLEREWASKRRRMF